MPIDDRRNFFVNSVWVPVTESEEGEGLVVSLGARPPDFGTSEADLTVFNKNGDGEALLALSWDEWSNLVRAVEFLREENIKSERTR